MKKLFAAFAITALIAFAACGPKTYREDILVTAAGSGDVTDRYVRTALMLKEIHDQAVARCDAKMLSAKDCQELNVLYGEARLAFIAQGDALKEYIDHPNDKDVLDRYIEKKTIAQSLIRQLTETAKRLRIPFKEDY